MHYEVTATIKFVIQGPLTMTGATEAASERLGLIGAGSPNDQVKNVTVTDIHIHREP